MSGLAGSDAGTEGWDPGAVALEVRSPVRRETRVERWPAVARERCSEGLTAIIWQTTPVTKGAEKLVPLLV